MDKGNKNWWKINDQWKRNNTRDACVFKAVRSSISIGNSVQMFPQSQAGKNKVLTMRYENMNLNRYHEKILLWKSDRYGSLIKLYSKGNGRK